MIAMVSALAAIVVGAVVAVFVAAVLPGSDRTRMLLSATALAIATLPYLASATIADIPIAAAVMAVIVFSLIAAGTLVSPWVLVAGWLLHAVWDLAAGLSGVNPVFGLYAPFCVGFDLVFALVVMLRHAVTPEPGIAR
jgi:hypothetical protein